MFFLVEVKPCKMHAESGTREYQIQVAQGVPGGLLNNNARMRKVIHGSPPKAYFQLTIVMVEPTLGLAHRLESRASLGYAV